MKSAAVQGPLEQQDCYNINGHEPVILTKRQQMLQVCLKQEVKTWDRLLEGKACLTIWNILKLTNKKGKPQFHSTSFNYIHLTMWHFQYKQVYQTTCTLHGHHLLVHIRAGGQSPDPESSVHAASWIWWHSKQDFAQATSWYSVMFKQVTTDRFLVWEVKRPLPLKAAIWCCHWMHYCKLICIL
jgi:hypothetical protein